MKATRLTVERFVEAIKGSDGIKSVIAKSVGCATDTLNAWLNKHPTLLKAYNTECDKMLGVAHSVVAGNIRLAARQLEEEDNKEQVDSADAKWYLARKGRKDGFGKEPDTNVEVRVGFALNNWRKQAKERVAEIDALEEE